MGYDVSQVDGAWFIARDQHELALAALKEECEGEHDTFSWVSNANVRDAGTLQEALAACGFEADTDDDGNITDLTLTNTKAGDEENILSVIAPYTRDESYVHLVGEDGEQWKYVAQGGAIEERSAELVWDRTDHDALDEITHILRDPEWSVEAVSLSRIMLADIAEIVKKTGRLLDNPTEGAT